MYRLGTADIWWSVAKDYPEKFSAAGQILKPLGHANVFKFFMNYKPRRILEIRHGARSMTFDIIHDQAECWGIDSYDQEKTVPTAALDKFRKSYPAATVINGFLGTSSEQLPKQYFDLAFSVSVVEHIPEGQIEAF